MVSCDLQWCQRLFDANLPSIKSLSSVDVDLDKMQCIVLQVWCSVAPDPNRPGFQTTFSLLSQQVFFLMGGFQTFLVIFYPCKKALRYVVAVDIEVYGQNPLEQNPSRTKPLALMTKVGKTPHIFFFYFFFMLTKLTVVLVRY